MAVPRPVVIVVFPLDRVAQILVGSGALSAIARDFELKFLVAPEVTYPLPGPTVKLALPTLATKLRRRIDLYLWQHALFRHLRANAIDHNTSYKVSQMRPIMRVLHRIAALPFFAAIIAPFDGKLALTHDPQVSKVLEEIRPALVLAPASATDSYSLMVTRSASRLGIPIGILLTHWDYFSKKGVLRIKPDKIYVWGEDMQRTAVVYNRIDPNLIRVVGAPQFEHYLKGLADRRSAARAKLRLPAQAKVLLFAGTAVPYDELLVLKRLDQALDQPTGGEVIIIYRRHPRAALRRESERIDVGALKHVVVDDVAKEGSSSFEHYLDLMAAIDGIVSPFSTMILEGALCGKPALCVNFADSVNDWNFAEATNTEHIKVLKDRSWVQVCKKSEDLEPMFATFIRKLDDPTLAARVKEEIKHTIYYNSEPYAERLLQRVRQDFGL